MLLWTDAELAQLDAWLAEQEKQKVSWKKRVKNWNEMFGTGRTMAALRGQRYRVRLGWVPKSRVNRSQPQVGRATKSKKLVWPTRDTRKIALHLSRPTPPEQEEMSSVDMSPSSTNPEPSPSPSLETSSKASTEVSEISVQPQQSPSVLNEDTLTIRLTSCLETDVEDTLMRSKLSSPTSSSHMNTAARSTNSIRRRQALLHNFKSKRSSQRFRKAALRASRRTSPAKEQISSRDMTPSPSPGALSTPSKTLIESQTSPSTRPEDALAIRLTSCLKFCESLINKQGSSLI